MTDPEPLQFAADFPPATHEEWRKLVDAALKGAPFDRLVSHTYDGLSIEPLAARRSDVRPVVARPDATPWEILARIDHPDPALANEIALRELRNGATGLTLVFADSRGDHGFGLPAIEAAVERVLDGVVIEAVSIEVDVSAPAVAVIDAMLPRGRSFLPPATQVRLGHDPLGAKAVAGISTRRWTEHAPHFARRLAALARAGFQGKLAAADGRVIHNSGGSEAQELAFALSVALAYWRALETEGVALEAARRMIFFRLSADADQFLTIAKFRALRKLWARVEVSCGLAAEPCFISAETAWRMMAQRDPHVNILRATIATFAAALGGADAITVLPFTAARGLPDRFARRIARNTQLLLSEESHLDKVADPAAGSGAVENLTDELCEAAWALFREIEAAGGIAVALETGFIQSKVGAVRAERAAAAARRKDALTGVSIFPNLSEADARVDLPAPGSNPSPDGLPPIRLAEPFEVMRDASDRVLAETGARPKILLANLGTPAEFTARSTFARNFFEAGGIEAVDSDGADAPAVAASFKISGASLACLCSADKVYDKEAVAAAQALTAAGVRHIYLAGRPRQQEATLKAAEVQSFIYEGCDALATLRAAYDILGIEIG
ncbi:MAG: methylmalonyl-CoA mutase family protein [Xanthobacteraceae bacterium]